MSDSHDKEAPSVLSVIDGPIATVTLNRPAQRNSLSLEMLYALTAALTELANRPDVKVVILAANGPAFCAGHDLKELTAFRSEPDKGEDRYGEVFRACSVLMLTITRLPQPVIAQVQGIATAAGCQLVATCDLAFASTQARFATPGVNIGLFCSTPMVALSRAVGRKASMEMLLTGDPISAEEAVRLGLINRAVTPEALTSETRMLAEKIAEKSRHVVQIGKEAFYVQAEQGLEDAYRYTADVMTRNMLARDAEEGISAFLEKRPPAWKES